MSADEITAEEFRKRLYQRSTTDASDMNCCPECDSLKVHKRVNKPSGGPDQRESEEDWYCQLCGEDFEEPAQREPETCPCCGKDPEVQSYRGRQMHVCVTDGCEWEGEPLARKLSDVRRVNRNVEVDND